MLPTDVLVRRAFDQGRSSPDLGLSSAGSVIARRLFGSASAPPMVDRFELGARLGIGGMGEVRQAFDPRLQRTVALKLLRSRTATANQAARLTREARAMAQLTHPNVVPIYDVGVDRGQPWLAMELVHGQTLAQWLADRPDGDAVLRMVIAVGRGLAAIHRAGLVHRDIKPSNVLVDTQGTPRVTDFGIARLARDVGSNSTSTERDPTMPALQRSDELGVPSSATLRRVTATGVGIGTPGYAAPEQRAGGAPSALADQYSYCVLARHAIAAADRVPSERWRRRVEATLARGLDPDPRRRWPTMDALLRALGRAGRPGAVERRRWLGIGVLLAIAAASAVGWAWAFMPTVITPSAAWTAANPVADAVIRLRLGHAATLEQDGHFRRALSAMGEALPGSSQPLHLAHQLRRGRLEISVGAFEAAAPRLQSLYFEALDAGFDGIAARAATALVDLHGVRAGRLDEALRWSRDAEAIVARARLGTADLVQLSAATVGALTAAGEFDRAYQEAQRTRDSLDQADGPELLARADTALLVVLSRQRRDGETLPVAESVLRHESAAHTGPHPHLGVAQMNLGGILLQHGQALRGRELLLRALAGHAERLGPDHPEAASLMSSLGNSFVITDDYPTARAWYGRALAVLDRTAASPARRVDVLLNLGSVARLEDDLVAAERWYLRALDAAQAGLSPEHPHIGWISLMLGHTHRAAKRNETALGYYQRAVAVLDHDGSPQGQRADALAHHGMLLGEQPQGIEAGRGLVQRAVAIYAEMRAQGIVDLEAMAQAEAWLYAHPRRAATAPE